jgi:integrase/recombinase XerD
MSKEIEAFIEYLVVVKGLSQNSINFYRTDLVQFEEFLGKSLIKANSDDVVTFLVEIKQIKNGEVINQRTLNRKLSSINSFFKFAYKEELISKKIKTHQFKITTSLPQFLSNEEIMEGVELIDTSNWLGLRDKLLILFIYATGLKVSEAMNLKKSDIEDGWVKVINRSKYRLVPIAEVVLELLNEYLFKRPFRNDYIFLNIKGEVLSRISAFNITKKYLKVSPHILRHSFATNLIIRGVNLQVIQELLGHSSMNTTQIYTHFQKQNLLEAVKKYHPLKQIVNS